MIRHYLTFAHQAAALDVRLQGWHLAECWSQEKNQLALHFIQETQSTFVEISLDLHIGYALLRDELPRARRNTIDFFGSALGLSLKHVTIDDGERALRLHLSDTRQLALFFFGGGGGNALLLENGTPLESFKKYSGEYDALLGDDHQERMRTPLDIRTALRKSDESPSKSLARAMPELGRRLATEALYRAGLMDLLSLRDLDDTTLDSLLSHVDALYAESEVSERYYIYHLPDEVVFALTELQGLAEAASEVETFSEIEHAVRIYRTSAFQEKRYGSLHDRMIKRLTMEQSRTERALANRLDSASHLARAVEWEAKGNVLMGNLHHIERGMKQVKLSDWEGSEQTITLDPTLSPVENAERYFRRARGARDQASRGEAGVEKTRRTLERLAALIGKVENAATVGALERIEKENKELFMATGESKEEGTAERFRRFEVSGGYEVFAGKNASNNDELTVRFAKPNDYWLHARGTSGSHVVLRWGDPKSKPPKEVLRDAASIAAYYSGARGAKLVPVAYTLKKYVRKPKGAAPGAVVMEREMVVMAEPKLPDGRKDE